MILIVDDNLDWCYTVRIWFEASGYEYKIATDGYSAIEMLYKEPFDLVILDLFMPQMSGTKLCEYIRQKFPQTRVVLMSGMDNQYLCGVKVNCHFYRKPIEGAEFLNIIKYEIDKEDISC